MKLYFSPGACSLSPHIVLRELGIDFEPVKVDLSTHKTAAGADFYAINPKGYVPAIELDNGEVLTEGPAIVQYLADQRPAAKLAPENGTLPRYRLQETLNFLTTEIHKQFSPLFKPDTPESVKTAQIAKLKQRFGEIAQTLAHQDYLQGAQFTVADAYLYTLLTWTRYFDLKLTEWPAIAAYFDRVGARPAVKAATEFEAAAKKAA